jgi:hypothetical protein
MSNALVPCHSFDASGPIRVAAKQTRTVASIYSCSGRSPHSSTKHSRVAGLFLSPTSAKGLLLRSKCQDDAAAGELIIQ